MSRQKREWNKEFIEYTKFIANHKTYSGLAEPFKYDGSPKWVVSGNSPLGQERAKWWDEKVKKMGLPNRAEVARAIHPKELCGLKPCQICGKKLSIFQVYPNKHALNRLIIFSKLPFKHYEERIDEIFDKLQKERGNLVFEILGKTFKIPGNIEKNKKDYLAFIQEDCKSLLSPGVMSNSPDRFDGFHTYNACCRSKEDTGRHKSNLARYSQDRRAYENWAEGDWNLSNRLMGEFKRFNKKIICPNCGNKRYATADHIGPISLGFTHRPKFNPLCGSCNSGKNNRLTLSDVKTLINDEKRGDQIISWHSKYIWDKLKNNIQTEDDALKLSKAMRLNLHQVLSVLYLIKKMGGISFIRTFLHPEYSFYDYKFENFDPLKLENLKIIKKPLNNKNKIKNSSRYIRISLESLDEYQEKENRKAKDFEDPELQKKMISLLNYIKNDNPKEAYDLLNQLIVEISNRIIAQFF